MLNTLYIPLYAKSFATKQNIILKDYKAAEIWEEAYSGLVPSNINSMLCYYIAMKSAVFDAWTAKKLIKNPSSVVLNIGCGLDDRYGRVKRKSRDWYDIDLPDIIIERREHYQETAHYHMIAYDPAGTTWLKKISGLYAIVVIEDAAMYMKKETLLLMLSNIKKQFTNVKVLINVTTELGRKTTYMQDIERGSRGKRMLVINDPLEIQKSTKLQYVREINLMPKVLTNQLPIKERVMFIELFNHQFSRQLYRLYEYRG